MAAESGSDFQQRRRRRRDPEEPEKTELSERELAVAVAVSQENDEENEERWVGPLPVEATLAKKRKVLEFERVYLDNLPSASMYERSYMHRDVITHVVCTKQWKVIQRI
ncbi:PPWD1 isoform 14 [Pan troglodytes]|uniref:Peptidylprolyl isomerase domain and WD repeat containing 1 n=6 Tax=Hominidae TaxID=9604 RepID=D6RHV0_HUMAN|nr:peptidylprolyl isomerase domain and WD repeat containing 1 [Homo sapiens]KAI4021440.1 peptidylprolyl isomerase domain and WD repeat containing 1 [Homo sapiens]PNI41052.1 PPWD1 isoform 14 [Pan troglodytes]PNJ61036.1 PPWD1 isoform 14 [Pongo abelii]